LAVCSFLEAPGLSSIYAVQIWNIWWKKFCSTFVIIW
jgi:hypothetical protein